MQAYGFEIHWERIIAPGLGKVYFRKVADRNMTGILMDLVKHAKFLLSDPDLSPYEVSLYLNKMPQCSRKEGFPIRAFQNLTLNSG